MTEKYSIRPFKSRDLECVQEIRRRAFVPVFRSFRTIVGRDIAAIAFATVEEEQAKLLDEICRVDSGQEVFVAEMEGTIIGFCSISFDRTLKVGEISMNAVDPEHQGQGVGASMFDHALHRMRAEGMKVATVGTGGDESHAPARRAYEKAGFGPALPSVYMYRML